MLNHHVAFVLLSELLSFCFMTSDFVSCEVISECRRDFRVGYLCCVWPMMIPRACTILNHFSASLVGSMTMAGPIAAT